MSPSPIPAEVVELAEARLEARVERDYARADELKAGIEAAGWKVVDDGLAYSLEPARPADEVEDGRTVFGAVESVPIEESITADASVVVVLESAAEPALVALAAHLPPETQLVVVAARDVPVEATVGEVVRTVEPWSAGDALEAGVRRATGAVVVVVEAGRPVSGDVVGPTLEALRDPSVAVVGADGLVSTDLHRYRPSEAREVTTVASGCFAFRRDEARARGPIDGRLRSSRGVAIWLGLLLRDEGDGTPRRAVTVELPLAPAEATEPDDARDTRRDGYRISDRFREQTRLRFEDPPEGHLVGDGADDHHGDDDADEPAHASET